MNTIELNRFRDCEEALKSPHLKQALYDDGAILMDRVLVTLHGEQHRQRRMAEMKVFRRHFFRHFEQQVIPDVFDEVMAAVNDDGAGAQSVDLVDLGYHFMVYLALAFAGIDPQANTREELNDMVRIMRMFGVAATLGQAKDRDLEARIQEVRDTLTEFDQRFFTPSAARRQALIQQFRAGELSEDELPMDVLTVLLRDEDHLQLVRDMVLRETAFYFLAGAHTSVHSLGHAVHHLLSWCEAHPEARQALVADRTLVQRFVHESFRLHPSSPISKRRALESFDLPDGQHADADDIVIVNLREANRDTHIFGGDPGVFNPYREIQRGVAETGITFGIGIHACLGKNLAAGTLPIPGKPFDAETHAWGMVPWVCHALLRAGIQQHPTDAPELDQTIDRETWHRYPVVFA